PRTRGVSIHRRSSAKAAHRLTTWADEVFGKDNARAVAEAAGRRVGRPVAHPADKIDYARLLKQQGGGLGEIAAKTGIPKTSLHRYLQG
ncbi:helix-turn-helix domain-containing protein, partial [Streptomyces sp. NPDC004129]